MKLNICGGKRVDVVGSSSLLCIQSHGARIVLLRHEEFKTIQCMNVTESEQHIFAGMEFEGKSRKM